MREFSEFEKKVIREKLITTGGGLSSLSEDNFRKEVQIIVHYKLESIKFEFRSDKYTGDQIYNTLIDLIELLTFLLENNYLYKHFLAATNLNDYNIEKQISICNPNNKKALDFLVSDNQHFISDFILKNENTVFKATEPLRALAKRGFLTQEEIRHNQIIEQAKTSNKTSKYIGIGTILVGIGSIVSTCSENKMPYSDLFEKIVAVKQRIDDNANADSLNNALLKVEHLKLKAQLDSIKKSKTKARKRH